MVNRTMFEKICQLEFLPGSVLETNQLFSFSVWSLEPFEFSIAFRNPMEGWCLTNWVTDFHVSRECIHYYSSMTNWRESDFRKSSRHINSSEAIILMYVHVHSVITPDLHVFWFSLKESWMPNKKPRMNDRVKLSFVISEYFGIVGNIRGDCDSPITLKFNINKKLCHGCPLF